MSEDATLRPAKRAVSYLRVSTARQASSGGEVEGYSIPAQRGACRRKAGELGAEVVDEYVDAGASARSADRPALQELLSRLVDKHDIDYVIVHKVDRLARDRADDVAIGLTIHKAGAILVSASEQIDDTPAGTLLHGIMATIAEFYSKNLSHETKKGLHEKAKRGGTPGYAPLGYLNSTERVEGREVKAVVLDPERAPHLVWAFETYSLGEWSITDLVEELARRGMCTRPTTTRQAVALNRSQVHRILRSAYYTGRLPYLGVEYDGKHPALIDDETWQRVQDVLDGRRISGDRSWKHENYLKGTIFCARCDSRMAMTYAKGRGGTYQYFYCLGRAKKRTDCDLPYLSADQVEKDVIDHWRTRKLASDLVELVRSVAREELAEQKSKDKQLLVTQHRRLQRLEAKRQKLIDAYLAEAIPVADLKQRQEAIAVEQRDAERLIELANVNHALVEERLEIALSLLEHCDRLYIGANEAGRRASNQAFFAALYMDTSGVVRAELNPPFAELVDRSIGLADDDGPEEDPDGPAPQEWPREATGVTRATVLASATTNPLANDTGGSDVKLMAEREGFEPSRGLSPP